LEDPVPVPPLRLGVNIDHVATLRNARGGAHPDPVRAAHAVLAAGADGITFHLREDRRHIRDDDVRRLKAEITAPLNFEMAATAEMMEIALATAPHSCCLVPERREERTTEGGLDVAGNTAALKPYVGRLVEAGIQVSLFIAPDPAQIAAAAAVGAPAIEFHTGHWADFIAAGQTAEAEAEFARVIAGARQARGLGIEVHAGHGLDYATSETIAAVPEIVELNTGHFIIGDAVFESLASVIRAMRQAMDRGRARAVAPGAAA
jgi:pyridoxine 5-phosphate synthase